MRNSRACVAIAAPLVAPDHSHDPADVRKKEILQATEASCNRTDMRLSTLQARYARDPGIMRLLDEYEKEIESGD